MSSTGSGRRRSARELARTTALAARMTLLAGLAGLLAGCGGGAGQAAAPATTQPASPAAIAAPSGAVTTSPDGGPSSAVPGPRTVEVAIASGRVETAADRVELATGDAARLVVTSDVSDELHVHGVEQEVELAAGVPTPMDVTFPEPGLYDVETHKTRLLLLQFVVR